jgi:hypothetical protein
MSKTCNKTKNTADNPSNLPIAIKENPKPRENDLADPMSQNVIIVMMFNPSNIYRIIFHGFFSIATY